MIRALITLIISLLAIQAVCQGNAGRREASRGQTALSRSKVILPDVRVWRMVDSYTVADSIPIDTMLNEHQINNPIWRNNVSNVTLGNLGSPAKSAYFPNVFRHNGNLFYDALGQYMDNPETFEYYNTKTPYSNFTYQMGYPKRRSEEYVHILFTQNVNKKLNVGFKYKLSSSIGRYESQRADHVSFRLFSSFDGDYYKYTFSGIYHKAEVRENGGILNDNYILYPDSFEYDKPEDIPVQFMDQKNRTSRYQVVYAHSLDVAHVERFDADSSAVEVPVATLHHKLYIDKSHHEYRVDNLNTYADILGELFPVISNDSSQTADSLRYFLISNEFQLKLNEEFNRALRFGLRAYIGNDVRRYHWPGQSVFGFDEDGNKITEYKQNSENRVTTYIGGQIFKNIGRNLRWSAGAKIFVHGYKEGDFVADGNLTTQFDVKEKPVTVFAKASLSLTTPQLFEESYHSNHYSWNLSLEKTKLMRIEGGVKIPGLKLELNVFSATADKYIYWSEQCKPMQKEAVTQVFGAYLYKHFSGAGFNSIDRLTVQKTSDKDVMPLPTFALYSSNFFEREFFGVLLFQIGFDARYNTAYFTPKYVPALMQFCAQNERKTGNYIYLDPFVNFHIKRVRFYAKYEHINKRWGSQDYFNTIHYPANPGTFKFGFSWNFYD